MNRIILTIAVAVASCGPLIAQEAKEVKINFGGANGAPQRTSGDDKSLDGLTPLKDGTGPVFTLGPGDLITLDVNGPRKRFRGKNLDAIIDSEREYKEKKKILFFSKTIIKHEPKEDPFRDAPDLQIGQEIQVYLVLKPLDGGMTKELVLPKDKSVSYRLGKDGLVSADVSVKLVVDPDSVAWKDRKPNPKEEQSLENRRKEISNMPDRKKVTARKDVVVKKGDVGTLELKLTARRD